MQKAGNDDVRRDLTDGAFPAVGSRLRVCFSRASTSLLQMRKNLGRNSLSSALLSLPLTILVLKRAPGAGGRHASLKEVYS